MWKLGVFEHEALVKIFDSLVVPILCCGSEVWGYEYQRKIEQVHIDFCKSVLGLGKYASNSAVHGECGRLPIGRYYIRFIKYWLKILKMDHGSFSRQCYDEMCKTDKLGTTNCVTKVKKMLFSYGYGCVWLTQSVGDETQLLNSFRLRIEDNFRQEWYIDISENKKLETYKIFKSLLEPEIYLTTKDSFYLRKELSKFRISNHNLMIEKGRQKGIPRELSQTEVCKSCDLGCVEDEYHFVIIFPAYENLRNF